MKWRYLVIGNGITWAKHTMTKDYFVGAVQRDCVIIDLQESKLFNKDGNEWIDIEGDKE